MKHSQISAVILSCTLLPLALADEKPAPKAASDQSTKAAKEPFVIYFITKNCPVVLEDEVGVMLINTGWEENPSPKYIIALSKGRTLLGTTDAKVADQALRLIPRGTKVRWYDSCSIPRSYGLPDSVRKDFLAAIRKAGLTMYEDDNITCYCEKTPGNRSQPAE